MEPRKQYLKMHLAYIGFCKVYRHRRNKASNDMLILITMCSQIVTDFTLDLEGTL